METFIGMHSSRRKTGERSQTLGYFVKKKTVVFLFVQHSSAEHQFDNQGCELVAPQANTPKVLKS